MARIKLKKQGGYPFQYHTTVRVSDINYGGHLGNDAVLRLCNEARVAMMRQLGCSELDLGDGQTAIVMTELAVNFVGEGFLFDEVTIHSRMDQVGYFGFRVHHLLEKADGEATTPVALVETALSAFDHQRRQIGELPESFLEAARRNGVPVDL